MIPCRYILLLWLFRSLHCFGKKAHLSGEVAIEVWGDVGNQVISQRTRRNCTNHEDCCRCHSVVRTKVWYTCCPDPTRQDGGYDPDAEGPVCACCGMSAKGTYAGTQSRQISFKEWHLWEPVCEVVLWHNTNWNGKFFRPSFKEDISGLEQESKKVTVRGLQEQLIGQRLTTRRVLVQDVYAVNTIFYIKIGACTWDLSMSFTSFVDIARKTSDRWYRLDTYGNSFACDYLFLVISGEGQNPSYHIGFHCPDPTIDFCRGKIDEKSESLSVQEKKEVLRMLKERDALEDARTDGFRIGQTWKVNTAVTTNSVVSRQLQPGEIGIVRNVDDEGDAFMTFSGAPRLEFIKKMHLPALDRDLSKKLIDQASTVLSYYREVFPSGSYYPVNLIDPDSQKQGDGKLADLKKAQSRLFWDTAKVAGQAALTADFFGGSVQKAPESCHPCPMKPNSETQQCSNFKPECFCQLCAYKLSEQGKILPCCCWNQKNAWLHKHMTLPPYISSFPEINLVNKKYFIPKCNTPWLEGWEVR